MTDVILSRRGALLALGFLVALAILVGADLVLDFSAGTPPMHLAIELGLMLVALGGIAMLWTRFREAQGTVGDLERHLVAAEAEAAQWRTEAQDLLAGLSQAIDDQFERWNLTRAEREVGMLLLKGLSHARIARLRRTSERTVRQQARALYAKAGLSGRVSLSAFFLEDLLLPPREPD